jgi:hypothetical protein
MTTQTVYQSQDSQSYDIYSDEDYVFVNGTSVSCTSNTPYSFNVTLTSPGATAYYQIITQSGTESRISPFSKLYAPRLLLKLRRLAGRSFYE